jgi:hypothetical protein
MRKTFAALTGTLALLAASSAWAQDEFATQGTLALSADRLFGFTLTKSTTETDAGVKTTNTETTISLLGRGASSPYSVPRLGIDGFVTDGLSLGGSLIFATQSSDSETESGGQSVSEDGPTSRVFVIAPRVGYGVMFDDVFGIWPRGGITYYTSSAKVEDVNPFDGTPIEVDVSINGLALTLEVPLVISPVPHVALTIGPTLDLPLTGTNETEITAGGTTTTTKEDSTIFEFGIQAGLLAWF